MFTRTLPERGGLNGILLNTIAKTGRRQPHFSIDRLPQEVDTRPGPVSTHQLSDARHSPIRECATWLLQPSYMQVYGLKGDCVGLEESRWKSEARSSLRSESRKTSDSCCCALHALQASRIEVAYPWTRCPPISMPFVSVSRVACLWQASGPTSAFSPE